MQYLGFKGYWMTWDGPVQLVNSVPPLVRPSLGAKELQKPDNLRRLLSNYIKTTFLIDLTASKHFCCLYKAWAGVQRYPRCEDLRRSSEHLLISSLSILAFVVLSFQHLTGNGSAHCKELWQILAERHGIHRVFMSLPCLSIWAFYSLCEVGSSVACLCLDALSRILTKI
jgi:hypothetical protein